MSRHHRHRAGRAPLRASTADGGRSGLSVTAYHVVLQYDAGNDLMVVAHTLMELLRLGRAEAMHRMWKAYHCGRAILFTTYRERAEFCVEQLAARGLRVELEKEC